MTLDAISARTCYVVFHRGYILRIKLVTLGLPEEVMSRLGIIKLQPTEQEEEIARREVAAGRR